jgi:hypothetical protein
LDLIGYADTFVGHPLAQRSMAPELVHLTHAETPQLPARG